MWHGLGRHGVNVYCGIPVGTAVVIGGSPRDGKMEDKTLILWCGCVKPMPSAGHVYIACGPWTLNHPNTLETPVPRW